MLVHLESRNKLLKILILGTYPRLNQNLEVRGKAQYQEFTKLLVILMGSHS